MPVSKTQMSYVHIMGHKIFFCDFLKNRFSGHSTFVLQTIDVTSLGSHALGSVTVKYNLVQTKGWRHYVAGKVTMGLAESS